MRQLIQFTCLALALTAGSARALFAAECDQGSDLTRPIALGAAGSNINSNTVVSGVITGCCWGTLGALVKGSGGQYILGNNHVLARVNLGHAGEGIVQPGLAQIGCPVTPPTDDVVAHLSAFSRINFGVHAKNKIDAAIAKIVQGDVSDEILNIGPISNDVAPAVQNLAVQKMGASSCITQGVVQSIGVDALKSDGGGIEYADECSGDSGTANFVNQIVVKGNSGNFAIAGDSGSLVVTTGACPRPVGLLFASDDSGDVFVNPIKTVLSHFGVSLVAGCTAAKSTDSAAASDGNVAAEAGSANASADDAAAEEATDFANISGMTMDAVNFAFAAKARHEKDLFAIAEVAAVGIGASGEPGVPSIDVYVTADTPALRAALPGNVEGLPVKVMVGGPIHAL